MKLVDEEPCPCESGKLYGECHKAMLRTTTTVADLGHIPENLSHMPLPVIPEPDPNTKSVFEHTGTGTIFFFARNGRYSLDCGTCGAPLAVVSDRQQISGIVLHCAACGDFNDT